MAHSKKHLSVYAACTCLHQQPFSPQAHCPATTLHREPSFINGCHHTNPVASYKPWLKVFPRSYNRNYDCNQTPQHSLHVLWQHNSQSSKQDEQSFGKSIL
eukprot:2473178-Amphidinium_carterae.1